MSSNTSNNLFLFLMDHNLQHFNTLSDSFILYRNCHQNREKEKNRETEREREREKRKKEGRKRKEKQNNIKPTY